MGEQKKAKGRVSRRDLIRGGSEVIGAAAAISGGALFAQQTTVPGSQRATSGLAGGIIKAFVRRPQGASVQQVKLWILRDDMVAVRTEASQCCYTIVNQALGSGDVGAGGVGGAVAARILGHGGVGIVEATGPAVERIRPGDRVLVTNTGSVATAIVEARLFVQFGRLALSNAQQCGKYPGLPG